VIPKDNATKRGSKNTYYGFTSAEISMTVQKDRKNNATDDMYDKTHILPLRLSYNKKLNYR